MYLTNGLTVESDLQIDQLMVEISHKFPIFSYNYQESKIYMPGQRKRGRQRKIEPQVALENADAFRAQFTYAWSELGEKLLAASGPVELWEVVKSGRGVISNTDYLFSERMFQIIHDRGFPRVRSKAQIRFLADSLGACGLVTPRRSREICAEERGKVEHQILRREFYIECSCGYQGPALDGGCRKCGTFTLSEELRAEECEE